MVVLGRGPVVSDYSYRYDMPRSEVHLARYGVNEVPPRRGMGGAAIGDELPVVPILVGVAGLAFLVWLLRRK